jgi:hypothetical protein
VYRYTTTQVDASFTHFTLRGDYGLLSALVRTFLALDLPDGLKNSRQYQLFTRYYHEAIINHHDRPVRMIMPKSGKARYIALFLRQLSTMQSLSYCGSVCFCFANRISILSRQVQDDDSESGVLHRIRPVLRSWTDVQPMERETNHFDSHYSAVYRTVLFLLWTTRTTTIRSTLLWTTSITNHHSRCWPDIWWRPDRPVAGVNKHRYCDAYG